MSCRNYFFWRQTHFFKSRKIFFHNVTSKFFFYLGANFFQSRQNLFFTIRAKNIFLSLEVYFVTFPFVPFALAVELHLKLNFLTCSLNLNNFDTSVILSRDAHITVIFQIGKRLYRDLES